jgi:3-phenylpropionate/cinnamic acid dioxygenase small subunit
VVEPYSEEGVKGMSKTPLNEREAVEAFLYREARWLDEMELGKWLELFEQDGLYCSPLEAQFRPDEPVILVDTDKLRRQRAYRLLSTPAYAQRPPSRTVRQVGNVELEHADNGDLVVRSVLVIHEVRVGDERQFGLAVPRQLAARCTYVLRRHDDDFKIAKKEVVLLERESPIENLSIVL